MFDELIGLLQLGNTRLDAWILKFEIQIGWMKFWNNQSDAWVLKFGKKTDWLNVVWKQPIRCLGFNTGFQTNWKMIYYFLRFWSIFFAIHMMYIHGIVGLSHKSTSTSFIERVWMEIFKLFLILKIWRQFLHNIAHFYAITLPYPCLI